MKADVRDFDAVAAAVAKCVAALGRIDIILANAGIAPIGTTSDDIQAFRDVIDVNLLGVPNTVMAGVPSMIDKGAGGAIVLTSSTQGLTGAGGDGAAGMTEYTASEHGVVGLMRSFAVWPAPHSIRVNTVHPSGVDTPMVMNDAMAKFAEEHPTAGANLLPVSMTDTSILAMRSPGW